MNDLHLGLMSSGYSSETGNDLPSARRIAEILDEKDSFASYFAVGGRISAAQRLSEGMLEDAVHMKGPAEIIRDDLAMRLPHYMVPNRVTVLDALPLTVNGKIDSRALRELDAAAVTRPDAADLPPRTPTEEAVAALWQRALKQPAVSIRDDFFAGGGNSLIAVSLINRLNRQLGCTLPLQVLFECPTVEELARRIDRDSQIESSRLVLLRGSATATTGTRGATGAAGRRPVFCWPGLGGYPMKLRLLAGRIPGEQPFFGVQSHGVNVGEQPYPTLREMARQDVELIRRHQPEGPYTLWGYSFGARVAFEVAHQLEQAGQRVEQLFLIAPGLPPVNIAQTTKVETGFADAGFVSIMFSVFAGRLEHPLLAGCLEAVHDEETFISFICREFAFLDCDLVRRIVGVVKQTFSFTYTPEELATRRIQAPVTVFKADQDTDSFLDTPSGRRVGRVQTLQLRADHYGLLATSGVDELVAAVQSVLERRKIVMPHVSIKHFPVPLDAEAKSGLVAAITAALTDAFECAEEVVSISLEAVEKEVWTDQVYLPEIVNGRATLVKEPNY
jgi:phenylpyruvate tautomerase PptA (4-oxalocrotonate tautomerase family)/pimeloyl-ACP methyl ester carboxylesterase/acyl carrier protein